MLIRKKQETVEDGLFNYTSRGSSLTPKVECHISIWVRRGLGGWRHQTIPFTTTLFFSFFTQPIQQFLIMSPTLKIFGLLVFITKILAVSPSECALAGPGFPSPSRLSNSSLLSEAIASFGKSLDDVQLDLQANDTAWAVALFSSKQNETLYEHYYTPPIDVGVSKVDRNSIFRIGSVSKVFSVWSFLISVGDEHFNDPITKYIPELANLPCTDGLGQQELYNDIDHVRWEEVTLGQLASHAAGIARDREL